MFKERYGEVKMELFNRTMPIQFAEKLLSKKEYVFIYTKLANQKEDETRGDRVKEYLRPKNAYCIEYFCDGFSGEQMIMEHFIARIDEKKSNYDSLRKNEMLRFLGTLNRISKVLVVDFTLMNSRFLGALFSVLNMIDWEEVYFCYTEPGEYKKKSIDEFDLSNVTMGYEQIPGLISNSDGLKESDWLIFLGFEGDRAIKLEEEASYKRRYTKPFISIPAMKTEWFNHAVNQNSEFLDLRLKYRSVECIGYVSAIDPFETYQIIQEYRQGVDSLVISPIGPKPVMLGCIMDVLENVDDMLLFDNPFQEGNNTESVGDSHFYDMTYFVKNVKNKRYLEA